MHVHVHAATGDLPIGARANPFGCPNPPTGIVITLISQLKHFLGIKVPSMQYTHETLEYLFTHLKET
jgi:hypothetical protein